jgi:hypothetical protein
MRAHLDIAYDYEEIGESEGQSGAGAAAPSAERLRHLPRELIEEIGKATLTGNKKLLDKLIVKVRETGEVESAHALQEFADKYD